MVSFREINIVNNSIKKIKCRKEKGIKNDSLKRSKMNVSAKMYARKENAILIQASGIWLVLQTSEEPIYSATSHMQIRHLAMM